MIWFLIDALLIGALGGYAARVLWERHREARRRRFLIAQIGEAMANALAWQAETCQCDECAAKRREREARVS